jgi:hypothetical protein
MDEKTCSFCGGELYLLGQLGLRLHYRCRDCGMNWSELAVAGVLPTPFGYVEES